MGAFLQTLVDFTTRIDHNVEGDELNKHYHECECDERIAETIDEFLANMEHELWILRNSVWLCITKQ